MRILRIFFTGIFISFLGTLPMGTLNISAMQISVSDGFLPAIYFSLGAVLVELIYVRVTLVAMTWFRQHKKLLMRMEWITLLLIIALALSSFYTAIHPSIKSSPILSNTIHRFWLGMAMSAVNPLQVPFWFGWSTVLLSRKILLPQSKMYLAYIVGIGIGTLTGHAVFIFGGKLLVQRMNARQDMINWVIGGIFLATGIIQAIRMIRHKDAISEMKEEPSGLQTGD